MRKRIALLMVILMVISMFPSSVFATGIDGETATDISDGNEVATGGEPSFFIDGEEVSAEDFAEVAISSEETGKAGVTDADAEKEVAGPTSDKSAEIEVDKTSGEETVAGSDSEKPEAVDEAEEADAEGAEDAEENQMPAFSQSVTVDDVIVKVEAAEGVFPEGATLSVKKVSAEEEAEVEAAVDEVRDDEMNVAKSFTFDIKVLDAAGNELQPADGDKVTVSFENSIVADPNLQTQVYHIDDVLTTDVDGEVASAESDGFSIYTVEFTYSDKVYYLGSSITVPVSEITNAVGINGDISECSCDSQSLDLTKDGVWKITPVDDFETAKLSVTVGNVPYEINLKSLDYEVVVGGVAFGNGSKHDFDNVHVEFEYEDTTSTGTLTFTGDGAIDTLYNPGNGSFSFSIYVSDVPNLNIIVDSNVTLNNAKYAGIYCKGCENVSFSGSGELSIYTDISENTSRGIWIRGGNFVYSNV